MSISDASLASDELINLLQLSSKTGAFKRSIQTLLEQGLISYTLPDKPSSRLQKYCITMKGRQLLAGAH